ncbi:MAG: PfkB family carbohydrate kinase, partial [Acidobacteriota bacterium]|nr:PfkB family carbohydrate kinase [Acidobacteriota bacterium]
MSILVVGSVAFDSIRTPFADKTDLLGGSATHFSIAASFFSRVRLVAVVGDDFGDEQMALFRDHEVDTGGLQRVPGKTFRWAGEYGEDPNNRTTLDTQLNVFADFQPELPEAWTDTPVVFLANIDPELQWQVLEQVRAPEIVAADTMNFWIDSKRDALVRTLGRVGILLINDSETRDLTGKTNVFEAADTIRAMGPDVVVIKRGEHGVIVADSEG